MCARIHVEDTRDIAHVAGVGGQGEGRGRGGLAGGAGVSIHCDVALTGACDAATTLYAAGLAAPQVVQQARNPDPSPFRFLGNIIVLANLIVCPILAQYEKVSVVSARASACVLRVSTEREEDTNRITTFVQ